MNNLIWVLFVLLLYGCAYPRNHIYVRGKTGFIYGPYSLQEGNIVTTDDGAFEIAKPRNGELSMIKHLRSIVLPEVSFRDMLLPDIIEEVMAIQRMIGIEPIIPIALVHDHQCTRDPSVNHDGNNCCFPRISFSALEISLYDLFRVLHRISPTGRLKVDQLDNNGVRLRWHQHPSRGLSATEPVWHQEIGRGHLLPSEF